MTLDAPTDAALLWALVRHRLRSGHSAARRRWPSVVIDVASAAPGSRLNLLLTDGQLVVGTTWTHALWTRRTSRRGRRRLRAMGPDETRPGGGSRPHHAVVATVDAVTTHALKER